MSSLSPEFSRRISQRQHEIAEGERSVEAYIAQRQQAIEQAISQQAEIVRARLPALLDDSHAIAEAAVTHHDDKGLPISPTAHYGTIKIRQKGGGFNDVLHTPTLKGWTMARISNYQAPYADPTKKIPDVNLMRDVVLAADDQELYLADISYNVGDIKKTGVVKAMLSPDSPDNTNPWILPENPCQIREQLSKDNLSNEVLYSLDIETIYEALANFVQNRQLTVE